MKLTADHFTALLVFIQPLDTAERRQRYRDRDFPRADLAQDLNKRYRWDLYWESGAFNALPRGEYKDAHIDTALRRAVREL